MEQKSAKVFVEGKGWEYQSDVSEVMPSPGDGIVQALADRTGLEMGKMKRIADCTLVVCAAVLSFALFGRLEGVGIGTIVAMFAVGKIISKCNGLFGDKIRAAAGTQR